MSGCLSSTRLPAHQMSYRTSSALACAQAPQSADDLGQFSFDFLPPGFVIQQIERSLGEPLRCSVALDELGEDLLIRQQIRHGNVLYCYQLPPDDIGESGGLIEHNGGHSEAGAFQGDSS